MKTIIRGTLAGGFIALIVIITRQFGVMPLVIAFVFVIGFFLGCFFTLYPLAKHRHLHMYYSGKKLVTESMLRPQTGLRDMTNQLIQPGDIVMMLPDQTLLIVSSGPT